MDANGLKFWMVSQSDEWKEAYGDSASSNLYYCSKNNRLQLLSVRTGTSPAEDFTFATKMLNTVPIARDAFGNYARWDSGSGHIMAGGSGPGEVPLFVATQGAVTDLVMGTDGILYVAFNNSLILIDPRKRWPNFTLNVANFNFWRLAPLPGGGVLALDASNSQLGKVTGQPLQTGPVDTPDPGILRSCQQNPNPPQLVASFSLPTTETFVALTPMEAGRFALLSWANNSPANQQAFLRTFRETDGLSTPIQLSGTVFPYSIAWLGDNLLAVLVTNIKEALIFDLTEGGDKLIPAGDSYVLADINLGPFAHGFDLPPYYANGSELLPLLPVSLNSFAATGQTNPATPIVFDSGASQTVWHRLFLEAVLPARCGVLVWLAAYDVPPSVSGLKPTWYPHLFGTPDTSSPLPDAPSGVWQSVPSEIPFAQSMLKQDPVKNRQGLFMVLVQRAGTVVRNLTGRYLAIRVQLNGDGRNTPEIAALRVYASRFSYVQHYLPEIYHEGKFPPDSDLTGPSTRRDFLERFVNLFEAQLTRIEDRVTDTYLLTRAESCPDDSLDWLGGWIGVDPSGYPPDRRRDRLLKQSYLYKRRGTAAGITEALDVATNGMCTRGAIIVIEDFRLRHIFATILGADLSIQNDPLLPGYSASSNSIVGDTLFLGDPGIQADLQALYATNLGLPGGTQAAQALYDSLANRMTVFIHNQVENVNFNLVRSIVEAEKPAHVAVSIVRASQPLMIGLASLLGVNTYLAPAPPRGTVTVDVSDIGRHDVVRGLASLDPRLENASIEWEFVEPVARINGPAAITQGNAIVLDASASSAPSGENIISYKWTFVSAT